VPSRHVNGHIAGSAIARVEICQVKKVFSVGVTEPLGLTKNSAVENWRLEALSSTAFGSLSLTSPFAGDIVCGYVDGIYTLEQTMCVAYERASRAAKAGGGGLMASVGLSAGAAQELLDKAGALKTVVACDNSPTNVTVAGMPTVYRPPCLFAHSCQQPTPTTSRETALCVVGGGVVCMGASRNMWVVCLCWCLLCFIIPVSPP
jgi:hypothetical protein